MNHSDKKLARSVYKMDYIELLFKNSIRILQTLKKSS